MQDFTFTGPFGPVECIVEPNRSQSKAVLIMAHGFRGSRDSGGRAAGVAYQAAAHCSVVRFNFTGTRIMSDEVQELQAVVTAVRERAPECDVYLLGRSLGGAASILTASQDSAIRRLILWAAPNDLRFTFRYVMGEADYARLDAGETLHYDDERGQFTMEPVWLKDFDCYDLGAALKKLRARGCKVLLLHCEGDETVLVEQGRRNAEILGDACEAHYFPHGDHSFTEYSEQAGAIISQWLGGEK